MLEKPSDDQLRNRYGYHPARPDQEERYERLRAGALTLAALIRDLCPVSPEASRAYDAVDEAMFLAIAAIARNSPGPVVEQRQSVG